MADFKLIRLKNANQVINGLDEQKLSLLATRVAQHLVVAGNVIECDHLAAKIFSEDELVKLQTSLTLNKEEVRDVISAISELLEEATYHNVTAEGLSHQLTECQINDSRVASLVSVWNKAKHTLVDAFANLSVLPKLNYIGYNITAEAGSDLVSGDARGAAEAPEMRGILQLGLNSKETLAIDFTREQLAQFHSRLNRIQAQLDAIADK